MEAVISHQQAHWANECKAVLIGCALLILGSFLKVPFYPVSFTMQTSALWMISLTTSPRRAVLTVFLYLGLATAGVAVFGGHSNPLWFMGKCRGYLIGFPLASYIVAFLKDKYSPLIALGAGHCIIYSLGFLGLMPFVGANLALVNGILIFLPSDLLKTVIAYFYAEKIHEHIH